VLIRRRNMDSSFIGEESNAVLRGPRGISAFNEVNQIGQRNSIVRPPPPIYGNDSGDEDDQDGQGFSAEDLSLIERLLKPEEGTHFTCQVC
jgi:hypothetical protein